MKSSRYWEVAYLRVEFELVPVNRLRKLCPASNLLLDGFIPNSEIKNSESNIMPNEVLFMKRCLLNLKVGYFRDG